MKKVKVNEIWVSKQRERERERERERDEQRSYEVIKRLSKAKWKSRLADQVKPLSESLIFTSRGDPNCFFISFLLFICK